MTITEIFTEFKAKVDTKKVEGFADAMEHVRAGIKRVDVYWDKLNSRLKQGFDSKWFDEFSKKVTDFRRIQLFTGGIRRAFDFADQLLPGMTNLSGGVRKVAQVYGKFTTTLVNARSAARSLGIVLGKSASGILPMVKAEIKSLASIIKNGLMKAVEWLKNVDWKGIFTKMKKGFRVIVNYIKTIPWKSIFGKIKEGVNYAIAGVAKGLNKLGALFRKGMNKIVLQMQKSNNRIIKSFGDMFAKISAQSKLGKFFSNFGGQIQGMTKNIPGLGKLTGALGKMGLGAAAAIGLVVVGVIAAIAIIKKLSAAVKQSVKDFVEFEAAMKGVKRITLASAKDMKTLEEAAVSAGEASIYGIKDAANAEKFLAMAGLTVDEVVGALPGTLQLAAAGEMDLATAADLATNVMSSNGLAVSDLADINDTLAYSASHSNQSIVELATAIQKIGPTGRLAGLSLDDMSSWLGVLANNGLKGAEAGTMLRNAIMDIMTPTKAMTKALAGTGLEMSKFVDGAGNINDLYGLMDALQELDVVTRKTFLASLDVRSYRALSPIIAGSAEELRQFNAEMVANKEGTAQAMSDIAFEGLDGAIKEYKSKMEVASVAFSKDSGLSSVLEGLYRMGSDIMPDLVKALALLFTPLSTAVTLAIKGLRIGGAHLGGMLKVVGKVAKAFFSIYQKALLPIGKVLDQVSAGVRKVYTHLVDTQKGPIQFFFFAMEKIGDFIGWLITTLLKIYGPVLFVLDVILTALLIWIPRGFKDIAKIITEKLIIPLGNFFMSIGKVIQAIWIVYVVPFFDKIGGHLSEFGTGISNMFKTIFDKLYSVLQGPLQKLYDTFVVPIMNVLGKGKDIIAPKIEALKEKHDLKQTSKSYQKMYGKSTIQAQADQNTMRANSQIAGANALRAKTRGPGSRGGGTTTKNITGGTIKLDVTGLGPADVQELVERYRSEEARKLEQEVG